MIALGLKVALLTFVIITVIFMLIALIQAYKNDDWPDSCR